MADSAIVGVTPPGPTVVWSKLPDRADEDGQRLRERIRDLLGSHWVDELVVEGPVAPDVLRHIVSAGRLAGRPIRVLVELKDTERPRALSGERWSRAGRGAAWSWVPRLRRGSRAQLAIKRGVDVALSAVLLVGLSPLLAGVAIGVRLSSPGPILYRWRVRGRNGRPFLGYKFRTMVMDADAIKPALVAHNEMVGPVFKLREDPRVTPFGRWLRRYSLDELPQLWSVLKGDMSLVGPRPPLDEEYRKFELWQMRKLTVTPGLTCLWQVSGRNRIKEFSEWARLDLRYIDEWSLWLDLKILVRTTAAILKGTGH